MSSILHPVLALIVWSFVIWLWMYSTRIPAMIKYRIDAKKIKRSSDLDKLPVEVAQIADNYNHLHEQPVVFYALAFYSHLIGVADPFNVWLAWAYVAARVAHSLIQCTFNYVPLRFVVFSLSTVILMVMAARNIIALVA